MASNRPLLELENANEFVARHIGISAADEIHMLAAVGAASRRELIDSIVPRSIARSSQMDIPAAITEAAALAEMKAIAAKNQVLKSFIGQGYYGTHINSTGLGDSASPSIELFIVFLTNTVI